VAAFVSNAVGLTVEKLVCARLNLLLLVKAHRGCRAGAPPAG
jgi:hypothetical protein